jgi:hypothetical protein
MKTLHDAVYAVYTNAVTVRGNDIDSLIAVDVNEAPITLNKTTIASKLAEIQAEEINKQETELSAKQSAQNKLTALGLTADEIKALLGVSA